MSQILLREDHPLSSMPVPPMPVPRRSDRQQAGASQAAAHGFTVIALPRAGLGLLSAIANGYGWASQLLFRRDQDIAETLDHLAPGHFLAGTIAHDEPSVTALAGRRKILLLRDLRSLLVSRLRMERQSERLAHLTPIWHLRETTEQMCLFLGKMGPELFGEILSILPWINEAETVTLRFDDLLRPSGDERRRLNDLLSRGLARRNRRPAPAVENPRAAEPWRFASYWSNEAEAIFTAFGGPQMNRLLGYERPLHHSETCQQGGQDV